MPERSKEELLMKAKFTRLWSTLLALVMVVGLLPTTARAEGPATEKANFADDPAAALALINAAKTGEADSTWDGSTNTLTLNGVNFTTTAPTAVKLPETATIVLNGDNTITGGDAASKDSFGIYASGDLTIEGTGTLTATCGAANDDSHGIFARGNMSITGNVTATGGAASNDSYGIHARNSVAVSGTVNAAGGSAGYYSYGIVGQDSVAVSGNVTATGGAAYAGSYGIVAVNYVSITGNVTAAGSTAYYDSHGINVGKDVFISGTAQVTTTGGTVTAAGDAEYYYGSYGIAAGNDVTISGTARVTAAGGTVTTADGGAYDGSLSNDGSLGIYAYNNMIVSETAQVTAAGRDGSVYCFNGNASIAGHTITFDANGGTGYMEAATGGSTAYILPANSFIAPDGKPFNCWIVNGTEQAPGAAINITADTTVTAVWAYTVSFDANGGTGEMAAVPGVLGEYTLPENGFAAPEGKQFKGWAASADGAVISGAAIDVSADTTLYAIWEDIPVVPAEYVILDVANSNWTLDSGESLSIRGSGEFSQFVGVKVDGTLVDAESYTVEEDSTIVTLKADYLNTLTAGSHTIELEWTDGSASTAFTVHAPAADNETQSSQPGGSRLWIWVALVVVIGAGGLGIVLFGKKKKYSAR